MPIRFRAITIIGLSAFAAGCSALPFGDDDRAPAPAPLPPLAAAPAGSVSAAPLPPPPGAAGQQPASGLAALDPALQGAATPAQPTAATGTAVGRTDLLGGWTITAAGDSCQLFMTLTTWSGGYRASTRGCNNPAIQKISAWNLEGNQVQLLDDSNATVARLYASSKTQYNGQTEGGGPVSVSR